MNFITKFRIEHTGGHLEQLRSIQALRGLAALAVMFAHLHGVETHQSGDDPVLSTAWIAGVSGVDLFFVISGFIMVWVAGDTAPSPGNAAKFLFARVMRIYPLWWLFAGAMAVYFAVTYGTPWDAENLAALDVSGTEHLVKSFLLIPHDAFPILQLGWTLMHEMYFYVVFALILLLPNRFRMLAFALWALIIIAATFAAITGFYANTLLNLALFPMTLEFLMGAGAAWMIKAGWTQWRWPALAAALAGLALAFISVDFLSTTALLPTTRTIAYGPAFALLVYALVAIEQRSGLGRFIPQFAVRLGDWSYSLYLCHLLVISAVARIFFSIFGQAGHIDNIVFLILSVAITVIVSALVYTLFERPVLALSKRLRASWFNAPDSAQTAESTRT